MPIRAKNTYEKENDTHERANNGHMPKNGQLLPTWYPILSGWKIVLKLITSWLKWSILARTSDFKGQASLFVIHVIFFWSSNITMQFYVL